MAEEENLDEMTLIYDPQSPRSLLKNAVSRSQFWAHRSTDDDCGTKNCRLGRGAPKKS